MVKHCSKRNLCPEGNKLQDECSRYFNCFTPEDAAAYNAASAKMREHVHPCIEAGRRERAAAKKG